MTEREDSRFDEEPMRDPLPKNHPASTDCHGKKIADADFSPRDRDNEPECTVDWIKYGAIEEFRPRGHSPPKPLGHSFFRDGGLQNRQAG
jgi:hypothetical protein